MNKNDILILLSDHLRKLKPLPASVRFQEVDSLLGLPADATKTHIDEAATRAGRVVVTRGDISAEIGIKAAPRSPRPESEWDGDF